MLAIAGGKGGCGKTTTAVGLARALATLGRRPLVVDADIDMPDLHHRTDVDREPGITAAVECGDPRAVAQRSGRFREVDILPCGGADTATAASLFEQLGNSDDGQPDPSVLLDCPAGASPDAAAPLRAADRTVLISTPRERSLRDAAKTAAMARELDAPPVGVVLVRSDGTADPSELFDCELIVHVPELPEPPLETQEFVVRHRKCAKSIIERNI
jgi:septum site-determining protein MinD